MSVIFMLSLQVNTFVTVTNNNKNFVLAFPLHRYMYTGNA